MRNINLFATTAAAALIIAGLGGWTVASTRALAPTPNVVQIDPFQMTMNLHNLPIQKYDDLSFVFN